MKKYNQSSLFKTSLSMRLSFTPAFGSSLAWIFSSISPHLGLTCEKIRNIQFSKSTTRSILALPILTSLYHSTTPLSSQGCMNKEKDCSNSSISSLLIFLKQYLNTTSKARGFRFQRLKNHITAEKHANKPYLPSFMILFIS